MVDEAVVQSIRCYLAALNARGIPVRRGVVFGSHARGTADLWSDIDLVVISPLFDGARDRRLIDLLWRTTVSTDSRIEPIGVGERQWLEDGASPIIEVARREGQVVSVE